MELNKAETRALEILRRRTRAWRKLRWLSVLVSLALVAVGIWGFVVQRDLWLSLGEEPLEPLASVLVYRMARGEVIYQFGVVMGSCLLAYTVWNWRGRVVDTLLIRLAQEVGLSDQGTSGAA